MTDVSRWHVLLDTLEACWCDPSVVEPDEVLRLLEERQRLLDALAALDASALDVGACAALATRVRTVLERDRAFEATVGRWRDELCENASRVREARLAAAGYARVPESETVRFIRKA